MKISKSITSIRELQTILNQNMHINLFTEKLTTNPAIQWHHAPKAVKSEPLFLLGISSNRY